MYFWNIRALKKELAQAPVPPALAVRYAAWCMGLSALVYGLPLDAPNVWDYVDAIVGASAAVIGTIYFYYQNGGSTGADFLGRYVSLNWVFGLRFLALMLALLVPTIAVLEWLLPNGLPEDTSAVDSMFFAALELLFYARLGHHVSAVRAANAA